MSVLIVCTANVCRSPVAEWLWRQRADELGRPILVSSAGVDAQPGSAADPLCVALLAQRGLDLRGHRAQRLHLPDAARHELILVMEPKHAQRIKLKAPVLAGRVQLLGRWSAGAIADPRGASREVYERCLDIMSAAVEQWLQRL